MGDKEDKKKEEGIRKGKRGPSGQGCGAACVLVRWPRRLLLQLLHPPCAAPCRLHRSARHWTSHSQVEAKQSKANQRMGKWRRAREYREGGSGEVDKLWCMCMCVRMYREWVHCYMSKPYGNREGRRRGSVSKSHVARGERWTRNRRCGS